MFLISLSNVTLWERSCNFYTPDGVRTVKLCLHTSNDMRMIFVAVQGEESKVKVAGKTLFFNIVNRIMAKPFWLLVCPCKIIWARCILLNLRSKTPQRAPLLLPT